MIKILKKLIFILILFLLSKNQAFPKKVLVIPHSHMDPSWLNTFKENL